MTSIFVLVLYCLFFWGILLSPEYYCNIKPLDRKETQLTLWATLLSIER